MPLIYGDTVNCCPPGGKEGKKKFQGRAFIPDDHIQLIAKTYNGANLNLEFEISDEDNPKSDREIKQKYKSRTSRKTSRSRRKCKSKRRISKRRREPKARCRCCRCGKQPTQEIRCDCCNPCPSVIKKCGCGVDAPRKQDRCKKPICSRPSRTCCDQSSRRICCCEKQADRSCCKKQNDRCCKQRLDPCRKKSPKPHKCCGKKHENQEEAMKCCPCCETMVPVCGSHVCCARERSHQSSSRQHSVKKPRSSDKGRNGRKAMRKSTSSEGDVEHLTKKSPKKSTSSEKEVKDQPKKSLKKSKSSESEVNPNDTATTSHEKEKSGERKTHMKFKSPKTPAVHKIESETKDHKNVYVAKRVSTRSLEENAVYGKYWYHRPPLENVITHCDEDCYEYMPTCAAPVQEDGSLDKERTPKNSGLCVGCKEPMCLICKHFICNCECNRPNFVICNMCHHKLVPKKKKVCPPPQQKRVEETGQNGVTDGDAMFLLPLLASMQANANCQSCNC